MERQWIDWMLKLQPGDVIFERGVSPRIVRSVHKLKKYGRWRVSVTLVIKRKSWTNRCYTVLNEQDLRQRCFTPSGLKKKKMTMMDKRINYNVSDKAMHRQTLTADDVIGLI